MTRRLRWLTTTLLVMPLAAAGCVRTPTSATPGDPPGPASTKPGDVLAMQAQWLARGITSYRYDFNQGGFFNDCPRPVRVYAHGAVIDSAFVVATGEKLDSATVQFCARTIDGLFQIAVSASDSGSLTAIQYDSTYGYPTKMDLAGPPDASGFLAASALQPE